MPEEELKGYMETIQKISKAIIKGVNADGININMSNFKFKREEAYER